MCLLILFHLLKYPNPEHLTVLIQEPSRHYYPTPTMENGKQTIFSMKKEHFMSSLHVAGTHLVQEL